MFLSAFGASKPLVAAPTDPLWANVQFLQTFDALTVGSTPSSFPNQKSGIVTTSTNTGNWTVAGSPSRFGNSIRSATSQVSPRVTLPSVLAGAFTVEWSIYRAAAAPFVNGEPMGTFRNSAAAGLLVCDYAAGTNQFRLFGGSTNIFGGTPALDTWFDFAICRDDGGTVSFFINGTLIGTTTSASTPDQFVFGYTNSSTPNVYGDELRITNVARYTGNYPPSHPFPTQ